MLYFCQTDIYICFTLDGDVCVCHIIAAAKNAVYLASDGHPMTRREIAAAALASGLFPGATMPEVTPLPPLLLYLQCTHLIFSIAVR